MSANHWTRRAAAVAALTAAAWPAAVARSAATRRAPAGGVHVDVGPLLENSGEPTAGWVARVLPAAISEALASVGQGGASVSVRIDYVLLGPQTGVGPAGASQDQMIGVVSTGGVERPLRASSSYYAAASDPAMFEQSNYIRVVNLCQAFAGWIARGY